MNKYETIFIVNPQLDEEQTKELVEKFKTVVEENGQLEKIEEWGKKRLAYEVDKIREGYYTLMHFLAAPEFPTELERLYKINENIMKYITVRREEK